MWKCHFISHTLAQSHSLLWEASWKPWPEWEPPPFYPPLKTRKTLFHWVSAFQWRVSWKPCTLWKLWGTSYGPGLISKGKEGIGFPGELVNRLRCSWSGYSVYSKGRRMWFTVACGRSEEMLKSVCNQVVQRPNECWGMVCCSLCCGWRNHTWQRRLGCSRLLGGTSGIFWFQEK